MPKTPAPPLKSQQAKLKSRFPAQLLLWNETENDRQMPWKGEHDPYKIWLSEVILQQTRVEQGRGYYERFIKAFPTVRHLAKAPEQAVFKLWEGLGYYSRCRNLIASAKIIMENHKGVFPSDYTSILSLKGIGPYTAAAIASFAFDLPYAVLDGNVFRVLSRIYDIELPIDSTEGKKHFTELAQSLLPNSQPGQYNQALMDFGATICKPVPECAHCFYNSWCLAYKKGKQFLLPIKEKKTLVRKRWFNYILLHYKGSVALHQRTDKDIWQQLYEPLLIESPKKLSKKALFQQLEAEYDIKQNDFELSGTITEHTQRLSHQLIHFSFLQLHLLRKPKLPRSFICVPLAQLSQFPFPKSIKAFLLEQ